MSNKALSWAFDIDLKPASRKFVLISLADSADDFGFCWPSYDTIAKKCSMGRTTVIAHIKALSAAGFLHKIRRKRKNGYDNSNGYQLNMGIAIADDHPMMQGVQNSHPKGSEAAPIGFETCTLKGSELEPKPSFNPQERERRACTRDDFLRRIDKGYEQAGFDADEFAHLTETEIKLQAEECWDRWGSDLRGRDPVIILRTWLRKGQSMGTVRKPPKADELLNASNGSACREPENELQPWHETAKSQFDEKIWHSWIRRLHWDRETRNLHAPTKFHADYCRQHFENDIARILGGAVFTHEPPPQQETMQ